MAKEENGEINFEDIDKYLGHLMDQWSKLPRHRKDAHDICTMSELQKLPFSGNVKHDNADNVPKVKPQTFSETLGESVAEKLVEINTVILENSSNPSNGSSYVLDINTEHAMEVEMSPQYTSEIFSSNILDMNDQSTTVSCVIPEVLSEIETSEWVSQNTSALVPLGSAVESGKALVHITSALPSSPVMSLSASSSSCCEIEQCNNQSYYDAKSLKNSRFATTDSLFPLVSSDDSSICNVTVTQEGRTSVESDFGFKSTSDMQVYPTQQKLVDPTSCINSEDGFNCKITIDLLTPHMRSHCNEKSTHKNVNKTILTQTTGNCQQIIVFPKVNNKMLHTVVSVDNSRSVRCCDEVYEKIPLKPKGLRHTPEALTTENLFKEKTPSFHKDNIPIFVTKNLNAVCGYSIEDVKRAQQMTHLKQYSIENPQTFPEGTSSQDNKDRTINPADIITADNIANDLKNYGTEVKLSQILYSIEPSADKDLTVGRKKTNDTNTVLIPLSLSSSNNEASLAASKHDMLPTRPTLQILNPDISTPNMLVPMDNSGPLTTDAKLDLIFIQQLGHTANASGPPKLLLLRKEHDRKSDTMYQTSNFNSNKTNKSRNVENFIENAATFQLNSRSANNYNKTSPDSATNYKELLANHPGQVKICYSDIDVLTTSSDEIIMKEQKRNISRVGNTDAMVTVLPSAYNLLFVENRQVSSSLPKTNVQSTSATASENCMIISNDHSNVIAKDLYTAKHILENCKLSSDKTNELIPTVPEVYDATANSKRMVRSNVRVDLSTAAIMSRNVLPCANMKNTGGNVVVNSLRSCQAILRMGDTCQHGVDCRCQLAAPMSGDGIPVGFRNSCGKPSSRIMACKPLRQKHTKMSSQKLTNVHKWQKCPLKYIPKITIWIKQEDRYEENTYVLFDDVRECLFPKCTSPHCDIIINAARLVLRSMIFVDNIRNCSDDDRVMFADKFVYAPKNSFIIDSVVLAKKIPELLRTVSQKHYNTQNVHSLKCSYAAERYVDEINETTTESYSASSHLSNRMPVDGNRDICIVNSKYFKSKFVALSETKKRKKICHVKHFIPAQQIVNKYKPMKPLLQKLCRMYVKYSARGVLQVADIEIKTFPDVSWSKAYMWKKIITEKVPKDVSFTNITSQSLLVNLEHIEELLKEIRKIQKLAERKMSVKKAIKMFLLELESRERVYSECCQESHMVENTKSPLSRFQNEKSKSSVTLDTTDASLYRIRSAPKTTIRTKFHGIRKRGRTNSGNMHVKKKKCTEGTSPYKFSKKQNSDQECGKQTNFEDLHQCMRENPLFPLHGTSQNLIKSYRTHKSLALQRRKQSSKPSNNKSRNSTDIKEATNYSDFDVWSNNSDVSASSEISKYSKSKNCEKVGKVACSKDLEFYLDQYKSDQGILTGQSFFDSCGGDFLHADMSASDSRETIGYDGQEEIYNVVQKLQEAYTTNCYQETVQELKNMNIFDNVGDALVSLPLETYCPIIESISSDESFERSPKSKHP